MANWPFVVKFVDGAVVLWEKITWLFTAPVPILIMSTPVAPVPMLIVSAAVAPVPAILIMWVPAPEPILMSV